MMRRAGAAIPLVLTTLFYSVHPDVVSAARIQFQDKAFRRIQVVAQEDMAAIAENEERLDMHVREWYEVVDKVQNLVLKNPAPAAVASTTTSKEEKITANKKENTEKKEKEMELADLEKQMAEQHAKTDSVRAALNNVMGPAMMVPVLQDMYGKFKGDIMRATKQEQKAKDMVTKQETEFMEWKKEGKTYLLKDKQRVIDYYKKQRDIQHKHYHSLLKMAHSMMERIKMVKGMCGKAANHEPLNEKEKQQLSMMAPNSGK